MASQQNRVMLDSAGSTPPHPRAQQAYIQALSDGWADPRRLHAEGRRAAALLNAARESLAGSLGLRTDALHLAPSHTAAIHSGITAARAGRRRRGPGIVLSAVERAAVHHAAVHPLPGSVAAGELTAVRVDRRGRVDIDQFASAVTQDGIAVACLQNANGEVGTVQPLEQAYEASHAAGVPLFVDADASVGHVSVPAAWDLLAANPADWGGGTGVGILGVRHRTRTRRTWPEDDAAWFPGAVHIPAAFAAAVALEATLEERATEDIRRRALVDSIRTTAAAIPDTEVVGDPHERLPHVVTFSCLYVDGEALLTELDRRGFAVGSGSACTASSMEPSHVLVAMGVLTHGNVRISIDRSTTAEDVARLCRELPEAVQTVRDALGVAGL